MPDLLTVTVRPIDQWPAGWSRDSTRRRKPCPFQPHGYTETMDVLAREAEALGATSAHLQVDCRPSQVTNTGTLRADAKVITFPGCILTVDHPDRGVMVWPVDTFTRPSWHGGHWWIPNAWALGLALESLRRVDRYGVADGRQYAGFAALPPGREGSPALSLGMPAMAPRDAADIVAEAAGSDVSPAELLANHLERRRAIARARKRCHPDAGAGAYEPQAWAELTRAITTLQGLDG